MSKSESYVIQWYGPFVSIEDVKEWEEEDSSKYNLYIFQAKPKKGKNKYYCGMTIKQTISKRLKNRNHHIHDFEDASSYSLQIWIGSIVKKSIKSCDVRICENIITSMMANIGVGEKHLENQTNKKPPVDNVYLINEWWKKKDRTEINRRLKNSVPGIIPEAMAYYSETGALYGISKLKHLGYLQ